MRLAPLLALAALAAAWALSPGHASAHALLVRSDPVVDAQLIEPPAAVSAWFSESLDRSLSTMRALDGTGEQVDDGTLTFSDEDRTMMRVGLQEELPPGFYVVVWETLSAVDGHFIKGSFPFTVLNPDGSAPSGPRPEVAGVTGGGQPTVDSVTGKAGVLVGAVGLVGSLAFAVWVVGGAAGQAPPPSGGSGSATPGGATPSGSSGPLWAFSPSPAWSRCLRRRDSSAAWTSSASSWARRTGASAGYSDR